MFDAMRSFLVAAIWVFSVPAFAGTGHLYNLSDGSVSVVKFSRWRGSHGPLKVTMSTGEILTGEYSVVRGGAVAWGSIYSSVNGISAVGSGSAAAVDARGQGSAVLTGNKGTILNCEFITNYHGMGACIDSRGTKYKLLF